MNHTGTILNTGKHSERRLVASTRYPPSTLFKSDHLTICDENDI